jgi:NTP pyrophosphatase (non-canonical NTP hydrolase)
MTANEYQELSQKSAYGTQDMAIRLHIKLVKDPCLARIIIACLKVPSEIGELNDQLVKHLAYDQPLDHENILEECGDILWYVQEILKMCNFTMEECMIANREKLVKRYPKGYTDEHAKERLDKKI